MKLRFCSKDEKCYTSSALSLPDCSFLFRSDLQQVLTGLNSIYHAMSISSGRLESRGNINFAFLAARVITFLYLSLPSPFERTRISSIWAEMGLEFIIEKMGRRKKISDQEKNRNADPALQRKRIVKDIFRDLQRNNRKRHRWNE